MIKNIIKEIAGFYNKKVIFSTYNKNVNKNTKSFKLEEERIGKELYITTIRIEEFENYIEVIRIDINTINYKEFFKLNKRG